MNLENISCGLKTVLKDKITPHIYVKQFLASFVISQKLFKILKNVLYTHKDFPIKIPLLIHVNKIIIKTNFLKISINNFIAKVLYKSHFRQSTIRN